MSKSNEPNGYALIEMGTVEAAERDGTQVRIEIAPHDGPKLVVNYTPDALNRPPRIGQTIYLAWR